MSTYLDEDVGESPIRTTVWQSGESPNPEGRPRGKRNVKPRSKMRTTLSKLYDLQKDATDIIRDSLLPKYDSEGKKIEIDKTVLETAKFVINKIESLNNSCLKEEMAIIGIKLKDKESGNDLETNQDVDIPEAVNFSMDMPSPEIKH